MSEWLMPFWPAEETGAAAGQCHESSYPSQGASLLSSSPFPVPMPIPAAHVRGTERRSDQQTIASPLQPSKASFGLPMMICRGRFCVLHARRLLVPADCCPSLPLQVHPTLEICEIAWLLDCCEILGNHSANDAAIALLVLAARELLVCATAPTTSCAPQLDDAFTRIDEGAGKWLEGALTGL